MKGTIVFLLASTLAGWGQVQYGFTVLLLLACGRAKNFADAVRL